MNDIKELLKEMVENKTATAEDKNGNVWFFGEWYGLRWHFRRNFGELTEESIRTTEEFKKLSPWKVYVSPEDLLNDDDLEWEDL